LTADLAARPGLRRKSLRSQPIHSPDAPTRPDATASKPRHAC